MKQSPSWEANSRSASEEFHRLLMELEISWPCSQEPTTGPYFESDKSWMYFSKLFGI
jgi:hypothetical protein